MIFSRLKLKLQSDRKATNSTRQLGFLWHYGHFMHDLVMPLNDWMVENQVNPKRFTLFINDIPHQSIGNYTPIIERLFGIKVKQLTETRFRKIPFKDLPYDVLKLRGYLMGPFSKKTFENIKATIGKR